jgi:ubiquinone/menaquinone biosynthesis C-methylase UbiE
MTGDDIIVEAFTELAPRYQETMDQELRGFLGLGYEEFARRLIETVSIDEVDAVLDVATGTAFIPRKLAETAGAGNRIVGLDITLAMLEHGRKMIETAGSSLRIQLVCASAMAMPLAAGIFDVVICGFGTHHMDVPQMISEVSRVLKTGGSLVIADVGASAFWRSFCGIALLRILLVIYRLRYMGSVRAQAEGEAFPNVRTAVEWRTMLSAFGFVDIDIVEFRARRRWYPCVLIIKAVT